MKTGNRIEEGKLISEFMELEKCTAPEHADYPCYYTQAGVYAVEEDGYMDLKYDSDWNYLMPVVRKIGGLTLHGRNPKLWADIALALQAVDMDWIYRGVVAYILWYNQKK